MQDMKRRFALYGFGFSIGIVLVVFFLGGKNASCTWLPNDRMLKIIRSKQLNYSSTVENMILSKEIDSMDIYLILDNGNIDFSKSETKNNPCRKYLINGSNDQKGIELLIELCDSIATVENIKIDVN